MGSVAITAHFKVAEISGPGKDNISLLKEAHTFEREELPQLNFPFSPHSYYAKASVFFHLSTLKKFSEQMGHGLPLKTCDGHTIYIPLPIQHAGLSPPRWQDSLLPGGRSLSPPVAILQTGAITVANCGLHSLSPVPPLR